LLELTNPPASISVEALKIRLPLPRCVVLCYGSFAKFVEATPGLEWVQGSGKPDHTRVRLLPTAHRKLRAAAGGEVGVEDGEWMDAAAAAAAAAAAGVEGESGETDYRQQQQQQVAGEEQEEEGMWHGQGVDFWAEGGEGWRVHKLVLAWLQQLAQLLGEPGGAHDPPACITLKELHTKLPVPDNVIQHYGGIMQFVDYTPGISWLGPRWDKCIKLDRGLHRHLRSTAAAGGGVGIGAGVAPLGWDSAEPGGSVGVRQRWTHAFAEQQQRSVLKHVQADAWSWMLQLAAFLEPGDPPSAVSFAIVKGEIPFPPSLMQHFTYDPRQVLQALPGVNWNSDTNLVSLEPQLHGQLRQAAAAAAAAGPTGIITPTTAPRQQQDEWQAGGGSDSIPPAPRAVQAALRTWLYELAELVHPGPHPNGAIRIARLEQQLPVPEAVLQHYGSVEALVEAVPGLELSGKEGTTIRIDVQQHERLRAEAAAAAAGPAPRAVQPALKTWLYELAELVEPGAAPKGAIRLVRLEQQLPIPDVVLQHYGSVTAVVEAVPGLSLSGKAGTTIRLETQWHKRLRAEAADADAADADADAAAADPRAPEYVHAAVEWLRQLAMLLDPDYPRILSRDLKQQLPIPGLVLDHLGGVPGFVEWVDGQYGGLTWEKGWVTLDRDVLLQLRAEAAVSDGPQQPRGGGYGAGMQRERPGEDSEDSRPWKRQAVSPAAAAGPYPHPYTGYGLPDDLPREVIAAASEWLRQLALWLEPARPAQTVHMDELRNELPVPQLVSEFFGSVSKFLRAVDGLHLDWHSKTISLEFRFHETLRNVAQELVRCSGSGESWFVSNFYQRNT
jgi:hypothetical protein